MSDDRLVHSSVAAGVARVVLDSPANRNALSALLVGQLIEALEWAAASDAVRVVELTHTGTTFCSGADLAEARAGGMAAGTARLLDLLRRIIELPRVVVASVDGHVRAGGMGLVGACDMALAGPASTFGFTEVRLGLAPAIISLTTLPRLIPRAASRYYLTGETFGPDVAERIGLITQAVDDIDPGTRTVLDALVLGSPQGLRETKALLNRDLVAGFDHAGADLIALSARLFGSDEAHEGLSALRDRRPPRWAADAPRPPV